MTRKALTRQPDIGLATQQFHIPATDNKLPASPHNDEPTHDDQCGRDAAVFVRLKIA